MRWPSSRRPRAKRPAGRFLTGRQAPVIRPVRGSAIVRRERSTRIALQRSRHRSHSRRPDHRAGAGIRRPPQPVGQPDNSPGAAPRMDGARPVRCSTTCRRGPRSDRRSYDVRAAHAAAVDNWPDRSRPVARRSHSHLRSPAHHFRLHARAPKSTPLAVGLYVLAAYWFTSSTSFANPAVTIARSLTDTFAGIADVPAFIVAQMVGAFAAVLTGKALWPGISPACAARPAPPPKPAGS